MLLDQREEVFVVVRAVRAVRELYSTGVGRIGPAISHMEIPPWSCVASNAISTAL